MILCVIFIHFSLSMFFVCSFREKICHYLRVFLEFWCYQHYNTMAVSIITTSNNSFSNITWSNGYFVCPSYCCWAVIGKRCRQKVFARSMVFLSFIAHTHRHSHSHNRSESYFGGGCRLRVKTTVRTIPAAKFIQIVSYLAAFVSTLTNVSDLCYHTVGVEENNEKANNHTHTDIHYALMHTLCHNVGLGKLTFTLLNIYNIYKTELLIFFILFFYFIFCVW